MVYGNQTDHKYTDISVYILSVYIYGMIMFLWLYSCNSILFSISCNHLYDQMVSQGRIRFRLILRRLSLFLRMVGITGNGSFTPLNNVSD